MFSGVMRSMYALKSAEFLPQVVRANSESVPLSIFRSFSRYRGSDQKFVATANSKVPGFEIQRIRGRVLGECSLNTNGDAHEMSSAYETCKQNAYQDMLELAQGMNANGVLGIRYKSENIIKREGITVEVQCEGAAVTLSKIEK